ncbi:MAG: sulfatase-like hydrolase/transferase [Bryobacteraceae bacterium]
MNRKAAAALFLLMPAAALAARPNVVLIMTDDQGYGHLGCQGNRDIQTPHIDRFSKEAVSVKHFYVTPLCAPTRAGLMTGRYNYRTGVVDTYLGRAMMFAGEVTLAEMLAKAGYRTGIFGKWHLGDTYPMRATDQGFQEAVVHKGGGIGQPADPPGNSYFDPVLQHNNQPKKFTGYCTDIFFNEALRFIEQNH